MNTDRIDECKEKLIKMIDKFRKEYSKALNNAVLYAPEIQEHECFDEFMYLDEVLYDTSSTLKGV